MNSFVFIAVSLALVVAASVVPEEEIPHNDFFSQTQVCIRGQTFIDQCNTCICSPKGDNAFCTLKACQPPKKPHIDGFTSTKGLECPPGKKFFDNRKSCTCRKTGKSAHCKKRNPYNG